VMVSSHVVTDVHPASIPAYTGLSSVPASEWTGVVAALLPGKVVATYKADAEPAGSGGASTYGATWRVERDGHSALVRVMVYFGGGATNGVCSFGMKDCSSLTPSSQVPGGQLMTYSLDAEYAHEPGRAIALLRDMSGVKRVGGTGVTPAVEVDLTAVAADTGPGSDGWTIGMGVAAQPILSHDELVALVQEMPLPASQTTTRQ